VTTAFSYLYDEVETNDLYRKLSLLYGY